MRRKALLTEGAIAPLLIRLTLPMILGIFAIMAFNLVDTFFVGRLGSNQLAAMSFTFPVVLIIASLAMGLGVGASAVVSRAIGEQRENMVRRLTTDSLILATLLVVLFVTSGLLTIEPVFRLLGAEPQLLPLIRQYMTIWYLGMPFLVMPMVGNNAIRATGDTRTPSMVMLTAMLVNVIFDPLLIFGIGPFPRLELAGAAIATVISRLITFVVALWILYWRERMITFRPPSSSELLNSWRQILYIGLPVAGTNMITPFTAGFITKLVAVYGITAVAAYGVASRIDAFALIVVGALSSVLSPFVGQNLGARRLDRLRTAVTHSQRFAFLWGLGIFLLLAFLKGPLARLFNDDPQVIDTITVYLGIVPLAYGLLGVMQLSNTTLNVLGKPLHATGVILLQMFALTIPLALLGSRYFGLIGIFAAAASANTIAGVTSYLWLRRELGRRSSPLSRSAPPLR